MEIKGELFGIRIEESENCSSGLLATIMTEDDEIWHDGETFDAGWLADLAKISNAAAASVEKIKGEKWKMKFKFAQDGDTDKGEG